MNKTKISFLTNSKLSNIPAYIKVRKLSKSEKNELKQSLELNIECENLEFGFKPCKRFFSKSVYEVSRIYQFENSETATILDFASLQEKANGRYWTYKSL